MANSKTCKTCKPTTTNPDADAKTGYTADLDYHHSSWFWVANLNGKKISRGSAFTRRGAIRKARRAARRHGRYGHARVAQTVSLF